MKKKHKNKQQQFGGKPKNIKMAPILISLGVIAVISMMVLISLPEESFNFNFAENSGRWQVLPGTKAELKEGAVQLLRINGDMGIVIPGINIDADNYDVCEIELKCPVAFDGGMLLFTSRYNQQFSYNFRYDFDTGLSGRFNKLYIYAGSHGAWQGIIKDILIIPATNAQYADIKNIKFIHSSPGTKIRAVWAGFTRYYDPRLGTCFQIASPLFVDDAYNSVMMPLLWGAILLLALSVASVNIFKLNPLISKAAVCVFVVFFLALWGLLDLRNNVYYLKAIGRDAGLYWGKSLSEKREIVTGAPDFIRFMKFCDEVIPMDARVFNFVATEIPGTPKDALNCTQFFFNLTPRPNSLRTIVPERTPPPFYIVYGTGRKDIKGIDTGELKMYKQYHEKAFILTK